MTLDVAGLIAGTKDTTNTQGLSEDQPDLEQQMVADPTMPVPDLRVNEPAPQPTVDLIDKLMERIKSPDEASPYLKLCIYGFYGCGKTVFTATGPKMTLHYDVEDGGKSIRNHPQLKGNVMILPFTSVGQFDLLLGALENDDPRFDEYKMFVFDSASAFQQAMSSEHIKREAKMDGSRSKFLPADGDQYLFSNMMKDYLTRIKKLNRHVIVTALAQGIKEEATGKLYIRPVLTPKVAEHLGAWYDMVGYMHANVTADGNFTNWLQVVPSEKVAAKTRIGGLPPAIENPTFNFILETFEKNGRLTN
jgi:hypothetical protein